MEETSTLIEMFRRATWERAAPVQRPFVRYLHPDPSPGDYTCLQPCSQGIRVSVLIPTMDANRDGRFENLFRQLDFQTLPDFEVIVIKGDPQQGRAINVGAALGKGKFLVTLDDDTALPDKDAFLKLVSAMENYLAIGMAGGINTIPLDAPWFVRRTMIEIPRRSTPPVSEITDSDLAEHPLLIMRAEIFKKVGGENELLPRGLDPFLRQEFRKTGARVVVVPNVLYSHLPPPTLGGLLTQFHRNGKHAGYVNHYFPQWAIETPSRHGSFRPRYPVRFRALRLLARLLEALVTLKPIWFLCQLSYSAGFMRERFRLRRALNTTSLLSPPFPGRSRRGRCRAPGVPDTKACRGARRNDER